MSSEADERVSRRAVLRAAAGTAAVAGSAGTAAASGGGGGGEGGSGSGGKPDFGGWLDGIDGGYKDARGQSEVTVKVGASGNGGNFAFESAGLWIDPGTTVKWEWTGKGGGHNVHAVDGASFKSDTYANPGVHFEHTFEENMIVNYQCDPHASLGMKGAVAVGEVPTVATGGYETILPDSAKTLGVAATGGMASVLGLAYFFMKYGGDYGEE